MSSFQASCAIPSYKVLGVPVHCVEISGVIKEIESWIADARPTRYVAITGMHGVSESRKDEQFREILKEADLVVPDGMPLIWLANWHRHPMHQRVSGTELLEGFCQTTGSRYRHFFYGGAPGVADDLAQHLSHRFGIVVAGTYTPPFRPLTREEEAEVLTRVEFAAPDVMWIGLSTPKQERWMHAHRDKLPVPVMLGVGAAFDFSTGRVRRAPTWMGSVGLEWFFRLLVDPKRLWRRYLVTIPSSIWSVSLEMFRLKKFE
jgi:N-acetylglucosaminyldiphosphoundecaprenol N-acetyl-beta-D-mannosaminyltransferase